MIKCAHSVPEPLNQEFFQNILRDLIKTYPGGSFKSIHNKLSIWFNFTTNSQRTHWVYGLGYSGQISGYILKELSMSGSSTGRVYFDQIYERIHRVLSKSYLMGSFKTYQPLTHWSHQDQSGEYIENLPTICPLGKVWVNFFKTLKNSQCACQARPPLPPVWVLHWALSMTECLWWGAEAGYTTTQRWKASIGNKLSTCILQRCSLIVVAHCNLYSIVLCFKLHIHHLDIGFHQFLNSATEVR